MRSRATARLGGLAVLPFLSLSLPLLALPVLARVATQPEWAALAAGESLGAIVALVVGYGWPLVGPARVAPLEVDQARQHLLVSTTSRMILFIVIALPAGAVAWFLAPASGEVLGSLGFLSTAVLGLSPSWYLIGRGDPRSLALYEVLPRVAAGVVGTGLVLVTKIVMFYPITMFVVTLVFLVLLTVRHRIAEEMLGCGSWRMGAIQLRTDWSAAVTVVAAGTYSAGTIALVSTVGPTPVIAVFVSADKLLKASLTAIVATVNALQGWVAEFDDTDHRRARGYRGLAVLAMVGVCGATTIWLAGPSATEILLGELLAIDSLTALAVGIAFFAIAINTGVGRLLLVPLGAVGWVSWSTIIGAAVGVPGIVVGTALFGVHGATIAFAASEVVVVLVQVIAFLTLGRVTSAAVDRA